MDENFDDYLDNNDTFACLNLNIMNFNALNAQNEYDTTSR